VRRPIADVTINYDKSRPVLRLLEDIECALQHFQVVGIAYARHVPAISEKARRNIVTECYVGMALDRYAVVVVDPAEVVELEMAGQRRGFVRDAFHHATVAAQGIDVVSEQLEAGAIVAGAKPSGGDRHSDTCRNSLTERSGGCFDSRRPVIFRVTGAAATQLAEALDVVERD